jgi:cell division protease FtsH
VNLEVIARGTPGFAGADLENLVNEAALIAAGENKKYLEMADFENAKDKVLMGRERKSMVISDDEKKNTAYHEAGHTLVGKLLPGLDPIHKVTIIPRGMALGVTQTLPNEDRLSLTKDKAENTIAFMMGGRIAEELIFGHKTTGAGNDIERATDLARRMVCEWGMSDVLGPLSYGQSDQPLFLGRELSQHRDYSEETARIIDKEVRAIVEKNYKRAETLLKDNIDKLHALAKALLEYESIDGVEVEAIMQGQTIKRPPVGGDGGTPTAPATGSVAGGEPQSGSTPVVPPAGSTSPAMA